jgi:hypothetical protein
MGLSPGSVKLWITGHSRGAAVANLLAADLTDDALYPAKESIYTYTFATPNVRLPADDMERMAMKDDYLNIHNYLNTEDFVAYVPLEAWGFTRYGITKEFTSTVQYDSMKHTYRSTGQMRFEVDPNACQEGINAFLAAAPDPAIYYHGIIIITELVTCIATRPLFDLTYNLIAPGAMSHVNYPPLIANFLTSDWGPTIRFFATNAKTSIKYAHVAEVYYAYFS